MWNTKKVSVVFPAYNEENNIANAVNDFFSCDYVDEVIVVDNNSIDKTAENAEKAKAIVIKEPVQGYGSALQTGLRVASGHYVITAEPDGTFLGKDVIKLLAYADDFDVVFGTRTTKELIWHQANMKWLLRLGNVFVAKLLEFLFSGPALTDVGCTMKLVNKEVLDKINSQFKVDGSHFSPEFMIICLINEFKCIEVPVNYCARIGQPKITGKGLWPAFKLGIVMVGLILRYRLRRNNF